MVAVPAVPFFFHLHGRPERSAGFRGKLTNAAIYATCRFHPQAAETGRRCQPGGRGRQGDRLVIGDASKGTLVLICDPD